MSISLESWRSFKLDPRLGEITNKREAATVGDYLQKKAIYLHASSQCVRSSSDRNQIAENIERIYTFFKKNKAFLDPAIIAPFRIEMAAASSASAAGAKRHGLDHLCRLAGRDDALTAAVVLMQGWIF
jgi:hypothetical protein